jgi:hypothetical protein
VWVRPEIFLEDGLGIAQGLKRQFMIGYDAIAGQELLSRPHETMSWLIPFRLIGSRSSAIHEGQGSAPWIAEAQKMHF